MEIQEVLERRRELEDDGLSGYPLEVSNRHWEQLSRQVFLELHKKLPKNSSSTILHSFGIWSKLERWKNSVSGCLMSWLKSQNKIIDYSLQQQWTISRSDCDVWQKVDFIQPVMTSSVARPRRSSKALPQTKLAPKNSGLGHWWSPASLIHSSFLNPGKTTVSEKCAQQMDEMHGKLLHLQSAPGNKRAQFSMTVPHTAQNQGFGSWAAGFFCLVRPLTDRLPLLQASWQLFVGKTLP